MNTKGIYFELYLRISMPAYLKILRKRSSFLILVNKAILAGNIIANANSIENVNDQVA